MKEYRQNVAAIILNKENKIWLGKRADGMSWGFPQGGIEAGEKPEGPCAGLRCCADRRMRGLLREAGAGKRPLNHKICTEPLARSV